MTAEPTNLNDSNSRVSNITVDELCRWMSRVEGKIDKSTNDHEGRLRRIEKIIYVIFGIACTGGATGIGSFLNQMTGM